MSCSFGLLDGMRIWTNSKRVQKAREGVLEFLLINHPLDCPICDQGGECDLQDLSLVFGTGSGRYYNFNKRSVENINYFSNPLVRTQMDRCIHCTRCVRFINEVVGDKKFGVIGRGSSMEIGTYIQNNFYNELLGNVVDLCPVGALCNMPASFKDRSWEYKSYYAFDIFDSLLSSVRLDVINNNILRVLPVLDESLNEEWISNKARWAFDCINMQRINYPKVSLKSKFVLVSWTYAINIFLNVLFLNRKNFINSIIGNFIDLESSLCMKSFFSSFGCSNIFFLNENKPSFDLRYSYLLNVTLVGLERLDTVLLIGCNPRLEVPLLNTRLKKNYSKNSKFKAYSIGLSLNYTTFPVRNLGNSVKTLLNFLEGKVFKLYNYIYKNYLNFSFLGKDLQNIYKSKINLFLGSSALVRFDSSSLINGILYFLDKLGLNYNNLNLIYRYSGRINALDAGLINNKNNFLKLRSLKSFNYFCGVDIDSFNFNTINKNSFNVYQGSFYPMDFDKLSYLNLILPVNIFIEESNSYLNLEGRLRKMNKVITNPVVDYTNCTVISLLKYNLKKKFINYFSKIDFNLFMENFINKFYNYYSIKSYFVEYSDLYLIDSYKLFVYNYFSYKYLNSIFSRVFTNYYRTDAFTSNSKTLTITSMLINLKNFI